MFLKPTISSFVTYDSHSLVTGIYVTGTVHVYAWVHDSVCTYMYMYMYEIATHLLYFVPAAVSPGCQ